MGRFFLKGAMSLILPLCLLLAWMHLAGAIDNPMVLPPLRDVFSQFLHPGKSVIGLGSLFQNVAVSLVRVTAGYFVAVLIALPLGILMGASSRAHGLFQGLIGLLRPVPPIAWVPLVLSWFGMTSFATLVGLRSGPHYVYLSNFKMSMLFIIFLGAFFPVVTSAVHAVQSVPRTYVDSARVLGARRRDLFWKVLLPGAAPTLVNGLRIGMGSAWTSLVSAEMLPGSISGVGYLITHAYELARIDLVMTGMMSIGVIGAFLDMVFRLFGEERFAWQHQVK
ncbi:MAG: ABC transporter permease [Synergistales bacterium]|nr:ABC transporter permease [Synergistales bacterium]